MLFKLKRIKKKECQTEGRIPLGNVSWNKCLFFYLQE